MFAAGTELRTCLPHQVESQSCLCRALAASEQPARGQGSAEALVCLWYETVFRIPVTGGAPRFSFNPVRDQVIAVSERLRLCRELTTKFE